MQKLSVSVTQTVFDQIRSMTRTAIVLPSGNINVGDRLTFSSSDEPSGLDRYASHVEAVNADKMMVCFDWPLAAPARALVNYCDNADSVDDAIKMLQVLDVLREALAK